MWTNSLITTFKMLTVIYFCKYKLNTYYVATEQRGSNCVSCAFFITEITLVLTSIAITTAYCFEPHLWIQIVLMPQLFVNFLLMTFSLYLCHLLAKQMEFGTMIKVKKWLYLMEFFIQFCMIGHLAILILKYFHITQTAWTIVFTLQMVLTEIIPFAYLVLGMFYRLKIYQKKESTL